jgi:hypothetical protein
MVTIPASATVPEGLTFTVGQITWTTCSGGFATTVPKEIQIRSEITPSPTTRMTARVVNDGSLPWSWRMLFAGQDPGKLVAGFDGWLAIGADCLADMAMLRRASRCWTMTMRS